jgi:predicted nucleic acid-binding protein
MTFVDTGVLAGAVLEQHPDHKACRAAVTQYRDVFTDAHALAETFSMLTGFYKLAADIAAKATLDLRKIMRVEALVESDYDTAIAEARQRGVMGGGIYDALHATFARRKGATRIVTRNPSHFAHVAPDVEILTP